MTYGDEILVYCPKCRAAPGQPCIQSTHKRLLDRPFPHAERKEVELSAVTRSVPTELSLPMEGGARDDVQPDSNVAAGTAGSSAPLLTDTGCDVSQFIANRTRVGNEWWCEVHKRWERRT